MSIRQLFVEHVVEHVHAHELNCLYKRAQGNGFKLGFKPGAAGFLPT